MNKITENAPLNIQRPNNENTVTSHAVTPLIFNIKSDGIIQDTMQSSKTGDCWLLTNLNAMRDTKWGAKIIKDSIKKDFDGNIIITFKGSNGHKKEFKIPAQKIVEARENGSYSSGDDDVIAIELAMEEYFRLYGEAYGCIVNKNAGPGELLDGKNMPVMKLNDFIELFSGVDIDEEHYHCIFPPESLGSFQSKEESEYFEQINKNLEEIEKHPGEYVVKCDFKYDFTIGSEPPVPLYTNHAYQLKKVITENDSKYVILVNPHDSSKEIKIPLAHFGGTVNYMEIAENPKQKHNKNIECEIEFLKKQSEFLTKQLDYSQKIDDKIYSKIHSGEKITRDDASCIASLTDIDTIECLFKDKVMISYIISAFDLLEYGWGKGKAKKALIEPIVNAYCEYALKKGVDENFVNDAKEACLAELDAIFYTNEKVIIKNLEELFDKIDEKEKNTFSVTNYFIKFLE